MLGREPVGRLRMSYMALPGSVRSGVAPSRCRRISDIGNQFFRAELLVHSTWRLFAGSVRTLPEDDSGVDVTFERPKPRRFDLMVGTDGLCSAVCARQAATRECHLGDCVPAFGAAGSACRAAPPSCREYPECGQIAAKILADCRHRCDCGADLDRTSRRRWSCTRGLSVTGSGRMPRSAEREDCL